jgi:hypothetical protein
MTHFIELTTAENGKKFIANVSRILRIIDSPGDKKNENTYIGGLSNNGGIYVRESYEDIQRALSNKLRLNEPIIRL